MTIETLDIRGLKTSNCILKTAEKAESIEPGSIWKGGETAKDLRKMCEPNVRGQAGSFCLMKIKE